jgi:hypothetical protein
VVVRPGLIRPAAVLVDAQSALKAVCRACFGKKRSQVQIRSPRPYLALPAHDRTSDRRDQVRDPIAAPRARERYEQLDLAACLRTDSGDSRVNAERDPAARPGTQGISQAEDAERPTQLPEAHSVHAPGSTLSK